MFKETVQKRLIRKKGSITTVWEELKRKQKKDMVMYMKLLKYFDTWSDEVFEEVTNYSSKKTYRPNEMINLVDESDVEVTHFIVKGTCIALRKLVIERCYNKFGELIHYKLHKNQNLVSSKSKNVEIVLMQVARFYPGASFGLGELFGIECKFAVEKMEVESMVIPKSLLLKYEPHNAIWKRTVHFLDLQFPTEAQLLEVINENRVWKRHILSNLRKRKSKIAPSTSIHEVPISARVGIIKPKKKFYEPFTEKLDELLTGYHQPERIAQRRAEKMKKINISKVRIDAEKVKKKKMKEEQDSDEELETCLFADEEDETEPDVNEEEFKSEDSDREVPATKGDEDKAEDKEEPEEDHQTSSELEPPLESQAETCENLVNESIEPNLNEKQTLESLARGLEEEEDSEGGVDAEIPNEAEGSPNQET